MFTSIIQSIHILQNSSPVEDITHMSYYSCLWLFERCLLTAPQWKQSKTDRHVFYLDLNIVLLVIVNLPRFDTIDYRAAFKKASELSTHICPPYSESGPKD